MPRHLRVLLADPLPGIRARAVVAGALVGLAAGALVHLAAPAEHRASVVLELADVAPLVDIAPEGGTVQQLAVDTDARIVRSDPVVEAVAAATGASREEAREAVDVRARPLSRVLEIGVAAPDREEALAGADRAAEAFLAQRDRLVVRPVRDYLRALQVAASTPVNAAGPDTRGDPYSEAARLEDLRQRAVVAELELDGPGRVVRAPRADLEPQRGDAEVPLASGAAAGALVVAGSQVLRARRRGGRV